MSYIHGLMKTHSIIIYSSLLLGLFLQCKPPIALAEPHHFIPHYQVTLGLSLADKISSEEQRQLPWRELEESALVPSRADIGFSYHHPDSRWFGEFSLRLFRIGFESKEPQIRSFADPKGRGIALGELSLRYVPKAHRVPKLLIGHFVLSLHHSHWQRVAESGLSSLEYNGWLQEDPHYSLSASPLDRFVIGASLTGQIAKSEYRLSVATPSSDTGQSSTQYQESGLLFDAAFGLKHSFAQVYLNFLYAQQLRVQESTLSFVDQRLIIQNLTEQRDSLQGTELNRDSLWLNLNLSFKLSTLGEYQTHMSSTLGLRYSKLKERSLAKIEEAVLAESQLIGLGLNSRYSLEFQRVNSPKSTKQTPQRWPDLIRMSYLWRDPHTQFAFDERHRSLLELIYQGQNSNLIFWWQHLWSSSRNRWSLAGDLLGISLEFSSVKNPLYAD